jgi:putative heme-binding domain-containing protein
LRVPPGFVVEQVAGPPLVRYPLFAAFDDRGRLYVAEGTGTNLPGSELVPKKLGRILVLEDTDGDGKFDTSKVFADQLVFPQGVLWHGGALYTSSHPSIWRLVDSDGDGKADRREEFVTRFNFNGNGCDIHGPFLGPDGWIYWTDGRHGYKVETREGELLEGLASRVWRCRPDGTGMERICGGGFDNPVELAWTPEGDLFGTMDQGDPGDALLHYVEGGVYPRDHPCVKEFVMTGPMLNPVRQYSAVLPVALCGLECYRSAHFGPDYQGSLFSTQFNVHRVEQHRLIRDGATFRSVEKEFLTTNDYDTHFTDVLEDADGSLLVVDMGAWFNYGCPTSKIAKPEILGAIYRIRREKAPAAKDPWGKSMALEKQSAADLTHLLDDPRPKVRDQAVTVLVKQGAEAVPPLAGVMRSTKASVTARRNAVWALGRLRRPESRAVVREALVDKEPSIRQAAIHMAGLEKDAEAVPALAQLVVQDAPQLRLKAAEALGRTGRSEAVPALLESVRKGGLDRFLEHALIYALVRLHDRAGTLQALRDPNPRVRKAGLIALDQMPAGALTREVVVPLLDTDDPDLQQAALAVISKHAGWSQEIVGLLRGWLASPQLTAGQEQSLTGALLAFSGEEAIQRLLAEALNSARTAAATRLALMRVLARCRLDRLPRSWLDALRQALTGDDVSLRWEAVATLKARNVDTFDTQLLELSKQRSLPVDLRIAALECLAARRQTMDAASFDLLLVHVSEKSEPLVRAAAARALGTTKLDRSQLLRLAGALADAGPIIVPFLTPAFAKTRAPEVGLAFVEALKRSPGTEALAADELNKVLSGYPEQVRTAARSLREKLAGRQQSQAAYLTQLTAQLLQTPGNVERGRQVFFSKKVGCYGCHRVGNEGGQVGPDLSQVGRFRLPSDLLESIVFPSSAIIPEFRAYTVAMRDGRLVTGMIVRESTDAVYLRSAELAEIRVARKEIEDLQPSKISIMPEGLEKTMTLQELSDLLEFLHRQR